MVIGRYGGCVVCVVMLAPWCAALETDQFTTPPKPLVDLGAEFQQEVVRSLETAVGRVNEQYHEHMTKADRTSFQFIRKSELEKAADRLTEAAIARAVFDVTVRGGTAQCYMEAWVRYGEFERQPMKFDPWPRESVYGTIYRPILMVIISPTVNFNGIYFGTDKLGHLFEQGYEYYEVFTEEMKNSGDEAAAYRKAVKLGIDQENGFFGMAIDNVYSNGDMAANYAGLKFYLNLTRPIVIDDARREPMLVLENNQWRLNPAAGGDFMRVYITEHLSEAMNPSKYGWPLRLGVRSNVKKLTPRWMEFYGSTPERERKRIVELTRWYGQEYGHSGFEKVVAMVEPAEQRAVAAKAESAKPNSESAANDEPRDSAQESISVGG